MAARKTKRSKENKNITNKTKTLRNSATDCSLLKTYRGKLYNDQYGHTKDGRIRAHRLLHLHF